MEGNEKMITNCYNTLRQINGSVLVLVRKNDGNSTNTGHRDTNLVNP